jgi:hypothetical protein
MLRHRGHSSDMLAADSTRFDLTCSFYFGISVVFPDIEIQTIDL